MTIEVWSARLAPPNAARPKIASWWEPGKKMVVLTPLIGRKFWTPKRIPPRGKFKKKDSER